MCVHECALSLLLVRLAVFMLLRLPPDAYLGMTEVGGAQYSIFVLEGGCSLVGGDTFTTDEMKHELNFLSHHHDLRRRWFIMPPQ